MSLLALSFAVAFVILVIAGILRALRLPVEWTGYAAFAVLVVGLYGYALADARANPWSLWKRSWEQNSGDPEQRRLARFTTQDECLKAQWQRLDEELKQQIQVDEGLRKSRQALGLRKVYLREGRTIFELGPRSSRLRESRAKFLDEYAEEKGLTDDQKARLAFNMSLPQIQATISVFCAPSVKYRFFPFYTPEYLAAADDLHSLGERTLALKAKQALGE